MDTDAQLPDQAQLEAATDVVVRAPREVGTVELIVRRPDLGDRELLDSAELDTDLGLVGDNWSTRGSKQTADGTPHPLMQLTLMNTTAVAAVAGGRERWPLAGDQLFVDFDLSVDHLPPGTHLRVGDAVVEITAEPHRGCAKFVQRFGRDAHRWVNSDRGKELRLRGANARVLASGSVRPGDAIAKI